MTISALFILFSHSINLGYTSQVSYDLKDLEVLERDKNFEEFLIHVNDIRPSERGRHWKEMFQNMAVGLIDYKIKSNDFSDETFKKIETIGRSSAMTDEQFFQIKRALFAKKYFARCFQNATAIAESPKKEALEAKQLCESELNSFWLFSKKDPDIGLDLAALLKNNKSTLKLWPFYEVAIKDSIAGFYCKNPAVQQALITKLYEESYNSKFTGNYKKLVNQIVPETCFLEIAAPLKASLTSINSNGLEKEMALNILEAKNQLTPDEMDLYAVLYLLDGPVVGDKMNIAWNKIEALSENYPKRQKLLNQIENLPLIPDKIFKDPKLPRHKAIINLFAKNFPEYLNYYGSTCVKYINNTGPNLLNVSSSFQCKEFLKAAEELKNESSGLGSPWLSDSVRSQYSGLLK